MYQCIYKDLNHAIKKLTNNHTDMEKDFSQFNYYKGEERCPFDSQSEQSTWWHFEKDYFNIYSKDKQWSDFLDFFNDWIIRKAAPNEGYDLSKENPWKERYLENIPKKNIEKDKLMAICRYYKGESECPDSLHEQNKKMLWFYESFWVNKGGVYEDNGEYEYADLMEFAKDDDTPLSLKKLLFNRYLKGCWSIETAAPGFKVFYYEYYSTLNTDLEQYYKNLGETE